MAGFCRLTENTGFITAYVDDDGDLGLRVTVDEDVAFIMATWEEAELLVKELQRAIERGRALKPGLRLVDGD